MFDDQLISGLRNGDEESFRLLVEQHQRQVINICFRFVHDRAEAEDLAQETFIEIHRSISRFRGQSSLSTWIHRIAVTKSLDFVRKRSRQKRGGGVQPPVRLDDSTGDIPGPDSAEPDKILELQERREILKRALAGLPKTQHAAFVLSKYDGMSSKDVAATMNTSVSSVESLVHRAKLYLQKSLREYYEKNILSG